MNARTGGPAREPGNGDRASGGRSSGGGASGGGASGGRGTGRRGDSGRFGAIPPPALFIMSGTVQYVGAALAVGLFALMPSTTVAWWRIAVSAVLLLAWRRPWRSRWTWRELGASALFGVVLATMNVLFYGGIARLPLGTTVSLEFLGPVAVAAWGARGARARSAVALALAGVVLIGGLGVDLGAPGTLPGLAFALGAGVAWAAYIVLGRRIASTRDGIDSLAVGMAAGAIVYIPMAAGTAGAAFTGVSVLAAVVGVAVFSSLVPYAVEQVVLRRVSAASFALLTSLLPATSLVVGLVMLRQVPSLGELGGLIAISAAVALTSRERAAAAVPDPGTDTAPPAPRPGDAVPDGGTPRPPDEDDTPVG